MKMVPCNLEKTTFYKRTKNYMLFEEFLNGDADCVQLVDHVHTSAKTCQSCLTNSLRWFRINNIKVVIRGEDVFLVKVKI